MSPAFRCAADSVDRAEPVVGTASTVRAFLLLEVPGPWGVDALRDSRLPAEVSGELARRARQHGVRPLLIRRHGRSDPTGRTVFLGRAHARRPWLEEARLDRPEQVLDLDLAALAAGRSAGLTRRPDPLFLVCTHGRHDVCCAERGRPVAAALAAHRPEETWEVSHIGGDRFAGNLLVLPQGLYYGRVTAETAPALADQHLAGHLSLAHLRGRSGYVFAVQAAEVFLRRELGQTAEGAVWAESATRDGDTTHAVLGVVDGTRWRVTVHTTRAPARQLTCGALRENQPPTHALGSVERLAPPD